MGNKELVRALEQRKIDLAQKIQETRQKKIKIVKTARKIWSDHSVGKIPNSEYQKQLREEFKGRNPQEWIDMYDQHIEDCKRSFHSQEEQIKKIKRKSIAKILIISLIILGIILGGLFLYTYIEKIPFAFSPPTEIHTQDINLKITENLVYEWTLENQGNLQSIKLSGSFQNQGQALVYLVDKDENEFLILDSSNLRISLSPPSENTTDTNTTINQTISKNQSTNITQTNLTTNITDLEPQINITNITEINQTTNTTTIILDFLETCEETCDLSNFNLNQTSYTLKINVIDTTLNIDKITYDIIPPESPTNETNKTIIKDVIKKEEKTKKGKKIKISGPDTETNIPILTDIPTTWNIVNPSSIKIYWEEEEKFINFDISDSNNDGVYDKIEWVVPHLSDQTFNIIVVTKAEHLDSNRDFISNIYEEVKILDNVWSETISNGNYVRITFEKKLTSKNDITIYPRIISGNPTIQVYEQDQNTLIAEFTNLNENQYNKILLTNLISESQDVFDLQVINGEVQFDHIVDPLLSLWANGNSVSQGMNSLTSSTNANGPTINTYGIAADSRWALNQEWWTFTMEDSIITGSINSVTLYLKNYQSGYIDDNINLEIFDGISWTPIQLWGPIDFPVATDTTESWDVSTILDTWTKINAAEIRIIGVSKSTGHDNLVWNVDTVELRVDYTSLGNQPPLVTISSVDVDLDNIVDLDAGTTKPVQIIFDVVDPNDYTDIDDSTVSITYDYDLGGEPQRNIFNCPDPTTDFLNTKTFTCTVDMEFYDAAGDWTATVSIEDITGPLTGQDTHTFQVNLLRHESLNPLTINFNPVFPGGTNILSLINTQITNEGNADIPGDSKIAITSQNLIGQATPSENIPGDNFRAASSADAAIVCTSGTQLSVGNPITIPNIALPRGPSSTDTISYCLFQAPNVLSTQDYSASWDISIVVLLVTITPRRRKKKKILDKKFLNLLDENLEDLLTFVKESKLKNKLQEIEIPLDIFKQKLSPAESICKYLKENKNLKFNEIAIAINRDQRTVWINYRNAIKKRKEKIQTSQKIISLPIKTFTNRKLSILEAIVKDLKDKGFTNSRIAKLLGKSPSNIWTIQKRTEKKQ